MSLFSALVIVFPGVPPILHPRDLQTFATSLQRTLDIPGSQDVLVHLKYGNSPSQDFDSPNQLARNQGTNSYRTLRYQWNVENRGLLSESHIWNKAPSKNIYRAYVSLGKLPKQHMYNLLAMANPNSQKEFIAPDSVSIQIDPIIPCTLASVNLECIGLMAISFSGYNYFTWQPLSIYWEHVSKSDTVKSIIKLCRDVFPVPELPHLEVIKRQLGELFLNASEYQLGDWIATIHETG